MGVVTCSNDLTSVLPVQMTVHVHGPIPFPTVDPPVPALWRPGFGMGQNKLSTKVRHRGKTIVLDRHDVGAFVPHVSVPPNLSNTLQTAMSSRKVNFASSKVLLEGNRVASCLSHDGWPTPMSACGDPFPMPIAAAVTATTNSAHFGMTLGDAIAGVAEILLDTLGALDLPMKGLGIAPALIKPAAGFLAGVVRVAATEGERSAELSFGVPFFSVSVGAKVNAKGEKDAVASGRMLGGDLEVSSDPNGRDLRTKQSWWTEKDGQWTQHESVRRHQQGPRDGLEHPTVSHTVSETTTEWGSNPFWGEPLSRTETKTEGETP